MKGGRETRGGNIAGFMANSLIYISTRPSLTGVPRRRGRFRSLRRVKLKKRERETLYSRCQIYKKNKNKNKKLKWIDASLPFLIIIVQANSSAIPIAIHCMHVSIQQHSLSKQQKNLHYSSSCPSSTFSSSSPAPPKPPEPAP